MPVTTSVFVSMSHLTVSINAEYWSLKLSTAERTLIVDSNNSLHAMVQAKNKVCLMYASRSVRWTIH
jgi:hypothetical protein